MFIGFETLAEVIRNYFINWSVVNAAQIEQASSVVIESTPDEKADFLLNTLFGKKGADVKDWLTLVENTLPNDLLELVALGVIRQLTSRGYNQLCDKAIKRLNLTMQAAVASRLSDVDEQFNGSQQFKLAISIYECIQLCRIIDYKSEVDRFIADTENMFLNVDPSDKLKPLNIIGGFLNNTVLTLPSDIAPPPKANPSFNVDHLTHSKTEEVQE